MLDVAIIGCGVIGAAAAYELSHYPLQTAIFEAENDVADCTTKANSAILHAGYDPEPGTRMARLNVEGSALAKEICARLDVPYLQCGSLVLALSPEELPTCRNCMRTASPTACRASGCFPQRKRLPWNRIWPPLSLARCMRPAPPSSARGSLRWQWQKWLCATAWSCTAAAL